MTVDHSTLDRVIRILNVAASAREAVAVERFVWQSSAEGHFMVLSGLCAELKDRVPAAPEVTVHVRQHDELPAILFAYGSKYPVGKKQGREGTELVSNLPSTALMQYEADGRLVVNGLFGGLRSSYHREVVDEVLPTDLNPARLLAVLERFVSLAVRYDWPSSLVRERIETDDSYAGKNP